MAEAPESNPKIDSLRAKVEADPKSRHFYPLAEELRKIGQLDEAEKVLRTGIEHHDSYLSAWISLGRVLKDRGSYAEALDALMRGLSLDPENVVAAKLLAHVHLLMGQKVEAIKKFKLVHALMPTDEEAEAQIEALDRELNPQKYEAAAPPPSPTVVPDEPLSDSTAPPFSMDDVLSAVPDGVAGPLGTQSGDVNFDLTNPDPFALGSSSDVVQEPEPVPEPELADEAEPFGDAELPESPSTVVPAGAVEEDPFAAVPAAEERPQRAPSSEDVWATEDDASGALPESAETVTMARILAEQGDRARARETFERVLARDPGNVEAREGLAELSGEASRHSGTGNRAARLEAWRRKVAGS